MDLEIMGFLALFGFLGAFIDAAVGGGGLITIPALMWTGLPRLQFWVPIRWPLPWAQFSAFLPLSARGKWM